MHKTIFACVIFLTFFTSCKRPCVNFHINAAFIGFSTSDLDTIIIREFRPNDNYNHLVDTFLITNIPPVLYITSNDTTIINMDITNSNTTTYIEAGHDWQIFIPSKKRTFSISSINSPQTENVGRICWNPINSLVLDNQTIIPTLNKTQNLVSGYIIYMNN